MLKESFTARRSLLLDNPGVPMGGTTHTLLMGIQMIKPGEIAWAHRHTLAAIRFIVQGDGKVFTVVNGEKCPMEPNDLILTPQWTWHDHQNPTQRRHVGRRARRAVMLGLNLPFYEPYPGDKLQAVREKTERTFATARRRGPAGLGKWPKRKRPLRYRWKDIEPQLRALADQPGSPYDGVALEYVNPITGGSTLPTLSSGFNSAAGGTHAKASPHFERGLLRCRRRRNHCGGRQSHELDKERLLRGA